MAGNSVSRRGAGALVALVLVTSGCAWLKRSSVPLAPATPTTAGLAGISGSGRFVAFNAVPRDYVATQPGDSNSQAMVRDNVAGTTELASVSSTGAVADASALAVDLSEDGRYVAFTSDASNLVAGDTDDTTDAFVRDRRTGTTTLVSLNDDDTPINGPVGASALSGDGRTVVLCVRTPPPFPGCSDLLVRHLDAGTTVLLPHLHDLPLGAIAQLSSDGTRVAYADFTLGNGPSAVWSGVADAATGALLTDIGGATLETTGKGAVDLTLSADGTTWALVESHDHFTATPSGIVTVGRVGSTAPPVVHSYRWITSARLSGDGSVLAVSGLLSAGATPELVGIDRGTQPPAIVSADSVLHATAPVTSGFDLSADGRWVAFTTTANETLGGTPGDTSGAVYTRSVAQALTPPS